MIGNSDGRWVKAQLPVPVDFCVCPVDVRTVTFGAARSMLTTGSCVAKYMLVVPESTMPEAFVDRLLWLTLNLLMFGKVEDVMSRVELKLAV